MEYKPDEIENYGHVISVHYHKEPNGMVSISLKGEGANEIMSMDEDTGGWVLDRWYGTKGHAQQVALSPLKELHKKIFDNYENSTSLKYQINKLMNNRILFGNFIVYNGHLIKHNGGIGDNYVMIMKTKDDDIIKDLREYNNHIISISRTPMNQDIEVYKKFYD